MGDVAGQPAVIFASPPSSHGPSPVLDGYNRTASALFDVIGPHVVFVVIGLAPIVLLRPA